MQPLLSEAVHKLDPKEWQLYTLIGELRTTGYECVASDLSRSYVFPPNPDLYLFGCRLAAASKAHTIDMGTSGRLNHIGSDGSNPCDRAKRFGVEACSENVARTRGDPPETRIVYQKSFFHCTAMMNKNYNVIGVGVYYGKNPYPTYWAQLHHKADKVDSSCHPAPGEIPPAPLYTTRDPSTVVTGRPFTGQLTLPPGYTLKPGINVPDGVFGPSPGAGGSPSPQPAPAPSPPVAAPAPAPAPAPAQAPAPAPAPAQGDKDKDKGEKGGKKDREGDFGENGSLDIKDHAAAVHGPPAGVIIGVALLALRG